MNIITLAYFISMFSRGIRTFSSFRKPLSTSLKPNFGPISPTTIPKSDKEKESVSRRVGENDRCRGKRVNEG